MARKETESSATKPEMLPSKKNFIEWYNSLLELAEIADRSYPVKGTFVWMPYGLKIMKNLVSLFDGIFQEKGIEEVLFPLLVPLNFAEQNDAWFNTFKDEAFYTQKKEFLLRPTGEPAMYPIFKLWIKKGKLPIRVYETVSSYRNESKTTHTLLRDRELSFWHEIHTVHKSREESIGEANTHKKIYEFVWNKVLMIPPIIVTKPKYEMFAGAESAFEFYAILPDGKLLENGSVNNLGQAYAKKFDLSFIDKDGSKQYMWQVCTGNGERLLAAVIAVHGDEKGLILPPKISPFDIVIIPIVRTENKNIIHEAATKLVQTLKDSGLRVCEDLSEITAGEKFNIWDLKGVPLRIELGENEVEGDHYTLFRRDLNKKIKVKKSEIVDTSIRILKEISEVLFDRALQINNSKIKVVANIDEASSWIKNGGVAKSNWCGEKECFDKMGALGPSIEAIGTLSNEKKEGRCIVCGKKTDSLTLIGKTY